MVLPVLNNGVFITKSSAFVKVPEALLRHLLGTRLATGWARTPQVTRVSVAHHMPHMMVAMRRLQG